ncbi:recombinase RecT [Pseudomonas alloputida]|uniref:recombinase RecT n=1 Tax=Pseudomonas alloputida TaxID=1940621 RepID=UPI003864B64B
MTTANPLNQYRDTDNQNAPAQRQRPALLDMLDSDRVKQGIAAVVGKHMSPERMCRLMVNAVHKTPALLQCDPKTVLGAFMTSAALGLEPNTPQGLAYLIPYKKRVKKGNQWVDSYDCQFQIGYKGLITLAGRAGIQIQAGAIHKGDLFDYMVGSDSFLRYRINLDTERGGLIGAFAYSKTEVGEMATVLPLSELHKIRSRSETFNALERNLQNAGNQGERDKAAKKLAETPWVMWEDDMAIKSAIKKHAKLLPMGNAALSLAVELDSQSDAGVIDLAAVSDADAALAMVNDGEIPRAAELIEHEEVEQLEGLHAVKTQPREQEPVVVQEQQQQQAPRQQRQRQPAAETRQAAPVQEQHQQAQDPEPDLVDDVPPGRPLGDNPPEDLFNAE